ncbi:tetratricopeptide repeat protein [Sulfurimonas sp. HSL3-7]|uniref:tetratricopeptide repeat protein n=1 Tax=Sulfonitrofixus jiaomeiensis TaxID=3131938 RepID=UPI0031F7D8B2
MNDLFIEFRDPLFGIIIFFSLVFVIALFSYWWSRIKHKEESRYFNSFLDVFSSMPTEQELKSLMHSEAISEKSALIMAQTYFQNGDYEKCIEIYLILLELQKEPAQKVETLYLLGVTYFKAGFLERAQEIFLQILKQFPRTPKALRYLLIIYEQMHQFDKALEVLEPLEELGIDNKKDRIYLAAVGIIRSSQFGVEEKAQKLLALYQEHHLLSYLIFEYLFRHTPDLAWKNLDLGECERMIDLLWNAREAEANLDIISSNSYLRELFSAKGLTFAAQESNIFEFDVLIKLNMADQGGATLQFDYLCNHCKQVYPFSFHRCPNCHEIDSVVTEALLTKDHFEENNSFQ